MADIPGLRQQIQGKDLETSSATSALTLEANVIVLLPFLDYIPWGHDAMRDSVTAADVHVVTAQNDQGVLSAKALLPRRFLDTDEGRFCVVFESLPADNNLLGALGALLEVTQRAMEEERPGISYTVEDLHQRQLMRELARDTSQEHRWWVR